MWKVIKVQVVKIYIQRTSKITKKMKITQKKKKKTQGTKLVKK